MLGLFNLCGDFGDAFGDFFGLLCWVFPLAFAFAFSLLFVVVEEVGRTFADRFVRVGSIYEGCVHFEDFSQSFELECVQFSELCFSEVHGF